MNTVDKIYQLNTVILPMFMFCICKIQLIYWKGRGEGLIEEGMRKYYTKGVCWEENSRRGLEKNLLSSFSRFLYSFILSRILDVYFSWEEFALWVSVLKPHVRKDIKFLKNFIQKTLDLLTINK